jgi:hypothetical protein
LVFSGLAASNYAGGTWPRVKQSAMVDHDIHSRVAISTASHTFDGPHRQICSA